MTGPNIIFRVAHHDERPSLSFVPKDCPIQFKKLMMHCWVRDPLKRPSFQFILEYLNKEIDNIE